MDERDRARRASSATCSTSSSGACRLVTVSSLAITGQNVADWTLIKGCPYAERRLAASEVGSDRLLRYTLVRLAQGVLVLWVVVTVVFLLSRASGNIAELMAPPDAPPETVALIEENLGLDKPLIVQYGRYLGDLLQGDLGESFAYRAPVTDLIREALPKTIQLGFAAFVVRHHVRHPDRGPLGDAARRVVRRRRQGRRPRSGSRCRTSSSGSCSCCCSRCGSGGCRRSATAPGSTSCSRRSPSAGTRWRRWPASPGRP